MSSNRCTKIKFLRIKNIDTKRKLVSYLSRIGKNEFDPSSVRI